MANKDKVFGDITIEDLKGSNIRWKNFRGEKKMNAGRIVNDEGNRNFAVFIDDLDFARDIESKGWPVTWRDPIDEEHNPEALLKVKVRYDVVPPKIVIVKGKGDFQPLTEETISTLDSMRIESASLILHPYNYQSRFGDGYDVSVYCKALYVVPSYDEVDLDMKYGADYE